MYPAPSGPYRSRSRRRFSRRILAAGLLAASVVAALSTHAAAWRQVGPEGGSVHALVRAAAHPDRVFAAAVEGGVFRSDDAGTSWRLVLPFADTHPSWYLDASPDGDLVLAGDPQQLFRSTDGGASWQVVLRGFLAMQDVAVSPSNPEVVYSVGERLRRSDDGGATWSIVGPDLPRSLAAVAFDPHDAERAWLAAGNQGAFRTTDGGDHWLRVFDPAASGSASFFLVAADAGTAGTVYLGGPDGLWVSHDGGDGWTRESDTAVEALVADTDDPGTVYVVQPFYTGSGIGGYDDSLYRFTDGGATATLLRTFLGTVNDVAPPVGGRPLLAGEATAGIERSDDGGSTWHYSNTRLHATGIGAFDLAPSQPSTLHAGPLDPSGATRSHDGGIHWETPVPTSSFSGASEVIAHPADPERAYLLFANGVARSGGPGAGLDMSFGIAGAVALAVDPAQPARLYAVTHQILPDVRAPSQRLPADPRVPPPRQRRQRPHLELTADAGCARPALAGRCRRSASIRGGCGSRPKGTAAAWCCVAKTAASTGW